MEITPQNSLRENLPDVSKAQKSLYSSALSQVGMGKIQMPILYALEGDQPVLLPALIDAFVSLDKPEAKGIHMSRLYLEVKTGLREKPVTAESLKEILKKFLDSHKGLSQSAFLELRFSLPILRKALVSGEEGYREYPVVLKARFEDGAFDYSMTTEILYSSTCPCSAALAQQLQSQAFDEQFGDQDMVRREEVTSWLANKDSAVAFPHAQRSLAKVEVKVRDSLEGLCLRGLIDDCEKALGTPVQAAVKRADEQEFARLNAANLMFCEDAARKLKNLLDSNQTVTDYLIHVEHQESLHPHDAVSRVVKGVSGGLRV